MELFSGKSKEEEDSVALIAAQDQEWKDPEFFRQRPQWMICHRLILAGVLCTMVFGGIVIGTLLTAPMLTTANTSYKVPRNVIFMISDGMGPASVAFARSYYQYLNDLPYDYQMPLDTILVGQSRTRSASTLVTDSAAGATAFSCGLKTFNGAVGVGPDGHPCGTILEAAKHQLGMKTGLVATSRITHATPASWSAHVIDRNQEDIIAVQQIGDNPLGRSVDLMFGGGYCHFLPKDDPRGCRKDNRNVFEEAKQTYGWNTVVVENRTAFDELSPVDNILPTIALFTSGHMAYEIDRDSALEPSLTEMTKKALDILSAATTTKDKGFFLMVEGSRIDMAAHSNDPAAHLHDILEYQNAVALVKEYVDLHPDTLMISTSDHETGGLSLARQVSEAYPKYLWYPDTLSNVKSSTTMLAKQLVSGAMDVPKALLQLGIGDATEEELDAISKKVHDVSAMDKYLSDMVSIRAELGWSTHGHSGVDVNLYAYGQWSYRLHGSHENTDLGQFLATTWDLNLTDTTELLNANDPSFHLKALTEDDKKSYTDHIDQYHSNPALLHH